MTLCGNNGFADVIKLRICPKTMTDALVRRGRFGLCPTQREDSHVKEAGVERVILSQAKECQGLPATTRS